MCYNTIIRPITRQPLQAVEMNTAEAIYKDGEFQMKAKKLPSQQELKELFNYNPEIGNLVRRKTVSNNTKKGDIAGSLNKHIGYLEVSICKNSFLAHRLIWKLVNNEEPEQIDHINHIREDNRLCNLRAATNQINCRNRSLQTNNTSGVSGVGFKSNRWVSRIKVDGKEIYLGRFRNKEDAVKTRKDAEIKYGYHPNHGRIL